MQGQSHKGIYIYIYLLKVLGLFLALRQYIYNQIISKGLTMKFGVQLGGVLPLFEATNLIIITHSITESLEFFRKYDFLNWENYFLQKNTFPNKYLPPKMQ